MGNVFKYEEPSDEKENKKDSPDDVSKVDATHVEKKSGDSDSSVSEQANVTPSFSSSNYSEGV